MERLLPGIGVHLGDQMIQTLLYADDSVIMAECAADLQKMLDVLGVFCVHSGLTVKIKISDVFVFNARKSDGDVRVSYDGCKLCVKSEFVYLGTLFEATGKRTGASKRCIQKGRVATYAMDQRCELGGVQNVHVRYRLFHSLVVPILTFGSENWGPSVLSASSLMTTSGFAQSLELRVVMWQLLEECHVGHDNSTTVWAK
jgi:hypothetical protein